MEVTSESEPRVSVYGLAIEVHAGRLFVSYMPQSNTCPGLFPIEAGSVLSKHPLIVRVCIPTERCRHDLHEYRGRTVYLQNLRT